MSTVSCKEIYFKRLEGLEQIIKGTQSKMTSDPPDQFINNNANFFIKSFLVMMCAYLESFLKDSLMIIIDGANSKLATTKLPHNLVRWNFNFDKGLKDTELKYENLKISITKKNLDDHISGNPYRTQLLFSKFGIDLSVNEAFNSKKEQIQFIVTKRNNVLHHNDEASDLTTADILAKIVEIKEYINLIDTIIAENC